MPPTRMRSSKRVMATLNVSSSTVETGLREASFIGTVMEKPLSG